MTAINSTVAPAFSSLMKLLNRPMAMVSFQPNERYR